MPLPPVSVSNIVEIKTYCYQSPQLGLNVGHWQVQTTTGTSVTTTQIAAAFDAIFAPVLKSCLNVTATYYSTSAQLIEPLPIQVIQYSSLATGIGTAGPSPLPTQVCGLISFQTYSAGRAFRGRKYVPFPPTSFASATGQISAAYAVVLANLGTIWGGTLSVGSAGNTAFLEPVIYHRQSPLGPTYIETFSVSPLFATQRRRGAYGQQNRVPL